MPSQMCPCEGCGFRAAVSLPENGAVCVECGSGEPEFWITERALPLTSGDEREFFRSGITHDVIRAIMEDDIGTAAEDPIGRDDMDVFTDDDAGGASDDAIPQDDADEVAVTEEDSRRAAGDAGEEDDADAILDE